MEIGNIFENAPDLQVIFSQLQQHHNMIEQVYKPLCEKKENLEMDWATRNTDFWITMLTELQALKQKMQQVFEWIDSFSLMELPIDFIHIRYDILTPTSNALNLIDEVGIQVTSYLPICAATKVEYLQQRHNLLKKLQKLDKTVQDVIDSTGLPGQTKCIIGHQKRIQDLKTRKIQAN